MPRRTDISAILVIGAAVLVLVAATAPARATSTAPVMYGPWALSCPRSMVTGAPPSCTIRYQPPGEDIAWTVFLDAGGNSRFTTTGWSRATCQRIAVSQDQGRLYRLTDATIPLWRMEDHADRLLDAMRSHIPALGDCPRQGADSEPYPETLLNGREADFTRALIAAETVLRGRGPDRNEGVTTSANLAGVTFRGSQASIDQVARIAAVLDWYIDGRTRQSLTVMPPPNYGPRLFDLLLGRLDGLGLRDLDIRLLGPYGPARVRR
jgi:hypothetical protein